MCIDTIKMGPISKIKNLLFKIRYKDKHSTCEWCIHSGGGIESFKGTWK